MIHAPNLTTSDSGPVARTGYRAGEARRLVLTQNLGRSVSVSVGLERCASVCVLLRPLAHSSPPPFHQLRLCPLGVWVTSGEGAYGVPELLQFSAVCGLGLDTVPIPGDATAEQIAAQYLDVAALAFRLRKPLSCRFLPVACARGGRCSAAKSSQGRGGTLQ